MEKQDELTMIGEDEVTINKKCEEINSFLDDVAQGGAQKISRENKIQLLKIQRKLAMLHMEDDEIDSNSDRALKDLKEEKEKLKKGGAIPKHEKYLNLGNESISDESSDTSNKKAPKKSKHTEEPKKKFKVRSQPKEEESCSKQRKSKKKAVNDSGTSNESSSDSDSTLSSSSSEEERPKRSKHKENRKLKTRDYLQILAERMDNRRAPKCEKFDEESGQSLKEYFEEFEEYCMENIKGDCKNWVKELEGNLSGDLQEAFKQFRKYRDSYPKLKKKLLGWYEDMEEARQEEYKSSFNAMSHKKGESLYLYSTRLERSFELAFPGEKVQKSTMLRQKYLDTVPSSFRKMLKAIISYDSHVHKQTKWKDIQRASRKRDLELKASKKKATKDDSETEEEIIINIGNDQTMQPKKHWNNSPRQENHNTNYTPRSYQPNQQQTRQFFNQDYRHKQFNTNSGNHFRGRAPNSNFSQNRMNQPNQNNYRNNRSRNRPIPTCQFCERTGHTIDVCRVRQGLCPRCGKPGHTGKDCWYNNNGNHYNQHDNYLNYNHNASRNEANRYNERHQPNNLNC